MKKLYLLLAVGCWLSAASADSLNCRFVGNWPFGPSNAVALDPARNLAFIGSGHGVFVLDVSDPSHPVELSEAVRTRDGVQSLCYQDSRLYVAAKADGLEIWDVSVPANPVLLGWLDTSGEANGIAIAGNYAYVACAGNGLRVVDVADPQSPHEVGYCYMTGETRGVAVAGHYAYVADDGGGLRVVDVADPQNPQVVGHCDTPGDANGVAIVGNYAYVADDDGGLRVINTTNPQNPQEAGYHGTPAAALGVAAAGDYAYVADYYGLQVYQFYGAGIEQGRATPRQPTAYSLQPTATIVRGVLELAGGKPGQSTTGQSLVFLLDATGRRVAELHPGRNDVSRLEAGVYFVQSAIDHRQPKVTKVVVTR